MVVDFPSTIRQKRLKFILLTTVVFLKIKCSIAVDLISILLKKLKMNDSNESRYKSSLDAGYPLQIHLLLLTCYKFTRCSLPVANPLAIRYSLQIYLLLAIAYSLVALYSLQIHLLLITRCKFTRLLVTRCKFTCYSLLIANSIHSLLVTHCIITRYSLKKFRKWFVAYFH